MSYDGPGLDDGRGVWGVEFWFAQQVTRMAAECVYGPMFSGKSGELVARVKKQQAQGKRVRTVSHAWDTRHSTKFVVSREGQWVEADRVPELTDELLEDVDTVAVDEGQFFSGLLEFCHRAHARGVGVIVGGLDYNAAGEDFGDILKVAALGWCTPTKLNSWCAVCGDEAPFTARLVDGVTVGGAGEYEPRCPKHFQPQ